MFLLVAAHLALTIPATAFTNQGQRWSFVLRTLRMRSRTLEERSDVQPHAIHGQQSSTSLTLERAWGRTSTPMLEDMVSTSIRPYCPCTSDTDTWCGNQRDVQDMRDGCHQRSAPADGVPSSGVPGRASGLGDGGPPSPRTVAWRCMVCTAVRSACGIGPPQDPELRDAATGSRARRIGNRCGLRRDSRPDGASLPAHETPTARWDTTRAGCGRDEAAPGPRTTHHMGRGAPDAPGSSPDAMPDGKLVVRRRRERVCRVRP
jgi:hypothetical protein